MSSVLTCSECNCLKCGKPMINLGNIDGVIYDTFPEQWDDILVCDNCKVKIKLRRYGKLAPKRDISDYTEIK